jgi:hypothetical protein
MLQSIGNSHTKRAYALLSALDAHQITLGEFEDAVRPLPSEVLQITGTMLALGGVNEPADPKLRGVHALCNRLAGLARVLS